MHLKTRHRESSAVPVYSGQPSQRGKQGVLDIKCATGGHPACDCPPRHQMLPSTVMLKERLISWL